MNCATPVLSERSSPAAVFTFAPPRDLARFITRVEVTPTCWLWTGKRGPVGYATFALGGRSRSIQQAAYFLANGHWPAKHHEVDHLCRVHHCVKPSHLEVVSRSENQRRTADARRAAHLLRAGRVCSDPHHRECPLAFNDPLAVRS